jgi:hypothetical protein
MRKLIWIGFYIYNSLPHDLHLVLPPGEYSQDDPEGEQEQPAGYYHLDEEC